MELLSLLFLYLFIIISVVSFRHVLFGHHGTLPVVRKFAKCEQTVEDGISQLPSDILVRIISFLPVKEAARTTILSRYWNGLWLLAPNLDFDASQERQLVKDSQILFRFRHKYVEWVNRVLQSHKAGAIDEFRIQFDLDGSFQEDIDEWISYAFAKGVQRLELDLVKIDFDCWFSRRIGPCCFPDRLLLDQSSTFFIRSLSLRAVHVTRENVDLFLHKFPVLESLKVQESIGLFSVEVCGPSLVLKHLEITHCKYVDSIIVRDVYCLVSLKIVKVRHLVVENVPELVNVLIAEGGYRRPLREILPKLSTCLSTLEVLSLNISYYDVNQAKVTEVPQLTELKELKLLVQANGDESLICLTSLITSSPKLEKLVVDLEWYCEPTRLEREPDKGPRLPLQHLKVIEYHGYRNCTADDELVVYLLENAVALEKVTIALHKVQSPDVWDKIRVKKQVKKLERLVPSSVRVGIS